MNDKLREYISYADEYTEEQLAETVLRKQSLKHQPACPKRKSKLHVKSLTIGLMMPTGYENEIERKQERGAPLTCIYEGYNWDCAHCLIKFT